MTHNTTLFDDLPDDVLGRILLFCPFPSAVELARGTCKSLRQRSSQLSHFWKVLYDRHGFFPPEEPHDETDYLMLGIKKCQLLFNIMQNESSTQVTLPCPTSDQSRFLSMRKFARRTWKSLHKRSRRWSSIWKVFNYRPGFVPTEERQEASRTWMWRGLGRRRGLVPPHMVVQNQSSNNEGKQSLSLPDRCFHFMPILPSLMDGAHDNYSTTWIQPPEFHIYQSFAMITGGTSPEFLLLDPFDGSLSVFKDCFRQAHRLDTDTAGSSGGFVNMDRSDSVHDSRYRQLDPPMQCLLQGNELSEVDLISNYFPRHDRGRITENFEVNYGGIDATPIFRPSDLNSYRLEGYLVSVVRCVMNLDIDDIVCTEFSTWTRSMTPESTFANRRLCRFPFLFDTAVVDACHLRVLVNIASAFEGAYRTISVYPLINWQGEDANPNSNERYFPKSLFSIDCQAMITTFSLDATGQTLLAATRDGDIQIWHIGLETAHRQQVLCFLSQPSWILELELTRRIYEARYDGETDFVTFTNDRGEEFVEKPAFPAFHSDVRSILVPNHLQVQRSGFVTLHDNREDGRSLLLWKLVKDSWQVVTLMHLDLVCRPRPWIVYDGHRIIVFGEDIIGPIILIYHVLNSDCEAGYEGGQPIGEAFAGGVYNMVKPHVVRLANQVRHVAMGGIETLDSIFMTCNERFIVVNTRRGNRLGNSPFRDGLLVIDLEDH